MTTECAHCGRPLDVDGRAVAIAEQHADGTIVCSGCEGLLELPEDIPDCDVDGCERPAPFSIETVGGQICRCRHCLIHDLECGWFAFYSP